MLGVGLRRYKSYLGAGLVEEGGRWGGAGSVGTLNAHDQV
jgi:hypothetical protein